MILRRPMLLVPGEHISLSIIGWKWPRRVLVDDYPRADVGGWLWLRIARAPVTDMNPEESVPKSVRLHDTDLVEIHLL